ncbi:MAG: hypothetical protein Q7S59_06125, partial [Sulfurimonas sp.]|nr:hypothetical protein [Sulfurimonas sp.]
LDELEQKLQSAIDEEEKHFKRFLSACKKLEVNYPFSEKTLENEDVVERLDQMTWRFVKIQDSIGRRLIPYVVEYHFDTIDGLTFKDMLNKLEKANILNAQDWNQFMILRNDIMHVYSNANKLAETLNEIYIRKDDLYKIYSTLKTYINRN